MSALREIPPYATADEGTHDLLTMVADPAAPVGRDAVALFLDACRQDAAEHGGIVSVNRVRALLDGQDLEPRRYSSFWSRFTGPGRPMRRLRHGEDEQVWELCSGSGSGNDGKPYPLRRWIGGTP